MEFESLFTHLVARTFILWSGPSYPFKCCQIISSCGYARAFIEHLLGCLNIFESSSIVIVSCILRRKNIFQKNISLRFNNSQIKCRQDLYLFKRSIRD